LRTQTEEAKQLGIFGAPTFTTADGEVFRATIVLNARSLGQERELI